MGGLGTSLAHITTLQPNLLANVMLETIHVPAHCTLRRTALWCARFPRATQTLWPVGRLSTNWEQQEEAYHDFSMVSFASLEAVAPANVLCTCTRGVKTHVRLVASWG